MCIVLVILLLLAIAGLASSGLKSIWEWWVDSYAHIGDCSISTIAGWLPAGWAEIPFLRSSDTAMITVTYTVFWVLVTAVLLVLKNRKALGEFARSIPDALTRWWRT